MKDTYKFKGYVSVCGKIEQNVWAALAVGTRKTL